MIFFAMLCVLIYCESKTVSLFQSQATNIPRHQHHRHSLSSRKVHRTRSSGATHHIWDDPMIEVNKHKSKIQLLVNQ